VRRTSRLAATVAVGSLVASLVVAATAQLTLVSPALAAAPAVAAAPPTGVYQNPVTADDAPDPDIVSSGGLYYAFTTGGEFGHIQEFSSADLTTWRAMGWPGPLSPEPGWVTPGTEWAPSVAEFGGTWVMMYATFDQLIGAECVSEAVASTVAGPYVNDSAGPLVCQPLLGATGSVFSGDIDPDIFIDPSGTPYLLWKAMPGGFQSRAVVWSAPLAPDGLSFAPGAQEVPLLTQSQGWETTIENPQMVNAGGTDYLLYSGGNWMDASYAVGYAACRGPQGPCGRPLTQPILSSTASVVGPGGEWAFQDASGQWWLAYAAWTAGSVGYPAGGARSLRIDPLCLATGGQGGPAALVVPGPTTTPQPLAQSCPAQDDVPGYRLVSADGGIFPFGAASNQGSSAGHTLSPVAGMADDPATGGYWEVAADGGVYTFGAKSYGDASGRTLAAPMVGMSATPDGGGYWLVAADGGVFAYGDAPWFGAAAGRSSAPVVGIASTPDGGGYWLVASDGGVFSYGDAQFAGSMGGRPLNRPIVGIAAMPDGGGYWLVASDGGVFSFGDAPYRGSTGAIALNQPIVGMAVDGDGGGYWLVAADGGIFSFGAARFEGSTGSVDLQQPVVGMAAT